MKIYVDTSVLVAFYVPESLSDQAEELLRASALPAVSDLTGLELASAVARKARLGELESGDAERIRGRFQAQLEDGYFQRLALSKRHYRRARDWIQPGGPPLRSLDALHLAAAFLAERMLVTADRKLGRSAEDLGVDVLRLSPPSSSEVHEPG